jgi:hypothetical protein
MLPLYEAKMIAAFDHRNADVYKSQTAGKRQNQPRYLSEQEHLDPLRFASPLVWIDETDMPTEMPPWFAGFSDVTSATNERTVIAALIPRVAVGNTLPLISGRDRDVLIASMNSVILDYVARQKVANLHLNFHYVQQFPVPHAESLALQCPWSKKDSRADWLRVRVLELDYTAWDMAPFARDLGDSGPPFRWDPERRALLRTELDAAFFHLYGVSRENTDYILDTFPIVRRKDEALYGEYRTKRLILEIFDAIQRAMGTGVPYQTILDPPPGGGPRHPDRSEAAA